MGNLNPKAPVSGLSAETHFFPYPNSKRCPFGVGGKDGERLALQYIDNALSDPESGITKPALILLEAVQGEGGCIPAPDEWLRGLREIATRHDVPLVIDEVQTGFGRTGSMFAFTHAGIRPDAIILSKALGGGYPLALIAYDAKYDKWAPGAHTGTFRGNQIAMVAGAATMRLLRDKNIVGHAQEMGARLQQGLKALAREFHCIGDVRGRGLMVGAEIVSTEGKLDGSLAKAVKVECFQLGMIIETGGRHGAVLRFLPSLLIEPADIDLALRLLGQSITNVRASEQARCRLQHTELDSVFLSTHLQKNDI
jgi:diaminobutyrate-2-oxoglutarate transaminase